MAFELLGGGIWLGKKMMKGWEERREKRRKQGELERERGRRERERLIMGGDEGEDGGEGEEDGGEEKEEEKGEEEESPSEESSSEESKEESKEEEGKEGGEGESKEKEKGEGEEGKADGEEVEVEEVKEGESNEASTEEETHSDPPSAESSQESEEVQEDNNNNNNDDQQAESESPSASPSLLRPRAAELPDPTLPPPWKKHPKGSRKPTNWRYLWPRPKKYMCPPHAHHHRGCKYLEMPAIYDPEIEGLPDWMRYKGKEGRLWSGMDLKVEEAKKKDGRERKGKGRGKGLLVVEVTKENGKKVIEVKKEKEEEKEEGGKMVVEGVKEKKVERRQQIQSVYETPEIRIAQRSEISLQARNTNLIIAIVLPIFCILLFGLLCWLNRRRRRREARAREGVEVDIEQGRQDGGERVGWKW